MFVFANLAIEMGCVFLEVFFPAILFLGTPKQTLHHWVQLSLFAELEIFVWHKLMGLHRLLY